MGLFKQMKQMKDVVAEAPATIQAAQQMQQAAMAAQAAPPAAPVTPGAAPTASALDAEAMAGVTLAQYADVSCEVTRQGGGDQAAAASIAASKGISQADWDAAVAAWNARFQSDTAAALRFNELWRAGI